MYPELVTLPVAWKSVTNERAYIKTSSMTHWVVIPLWVYGVGEQTCCVNSDAKNF